jgi:hypothetical protein
LTSDTRRVGEHARDNRLVEDVDEVALGKLCDAAQRIDSKLASENRGEDERSVALVGQVAESSRNDVADGLRDGHLPRVGSL